MLAIKQHESIREGKIALAALLVLPVLLAIAALAVFSVEANETRLELQGAGDAAALAAVQVFVDDRKLLGRRQDLLDLLEKAKQEAGRYAHINPAWGSPVVLDPNPRNDPDGDLVFGHLDNFRDRRLVVANLSERKSEDFRHINAARVRAFRTLDRGRPAWLHGNFYMGLRPLDVRAVATAMLDRDVIGFRPVGEQRLPLVPIALLSDPAGKTKECWEYQVEKGKGEDRWQFDRKKRKAVSGSDGLHEMDVRLHRSRQGQKLPSACVLQLGLDDPRRLGEQLALGVSREHLADLGGQLVLGRGNQLLVPGTPWLGRTGTGFGQTVRQGLQDLAKDCRPRIWPLYTGLDRKSGQPRLSGFVAARVMSVKSESEGSDVRFTVQPCMMPVAAAVTDPSRRGGNGRSIVNRYICKVRLTE
jgi:hypothetical protein